MSFTNGQVDDYEDFFGALLESGHGLEEAFQGVRDLASGAYGATAAVDGFRECFAEDSPSINTEGASG